MTKFIHVRTFDFDVFTTGFIPKPKGGVTIAYKLKKLINGNNDFILQVGFAVCSPKDVYNKKLGNSIALGRLEKNVENNTYMFIGNDEIKDNRFGIGDNGRGMITVNSHLLLAEHLLDTALTQNYNNDVNNPRGAYYYICLHDIIHNNIKDWHYTNSK